MMADTKVSHSRSKSLGDLCDLDAAQTDQAPLDTPETPKSTKSAKFSISPKLGLKPVYLLGRRSWYNLRCKFKQDEAERGFELISSTAQYAEPRAHFLPTPRNQSVSTIVASSSSQLRLGPSPEILGDPFVSQESQYSLASPEESDRESAFSYEGPFRQQSMHFYKRQSTLYDQDSEYGDEDFYDWSGADDETEEDLSHLEDPATGFYQHSNINTTAFSQRDSYDDLIDEVCRLQTEDERDEFLPVLGRSRSEFLPRDRSPVAYRRYSMVIRTSDVAVTLFSPLQSPVREHSARSNRTTLTPITETPPPPPPPPRATG